MKKLLPFVPYCSFRDAPERLVHPLSRTHQCKLRRHSKSLITNQFAGSSPWIWHCILPFSISLLTTTLLGTVIHVRIWFRLPYCVLLLIQLSALCKLVFQLSDSRKCNLKRWFTSQVYFFSITHVNAGLKALEKYIYTFCILGRANCAARHTHIHTYIHTYTHTHTHPYLSFAPVLLKAVAVVKAHISQQTSVGLSSLLSLLFEVPKHKCYFLFVFVKCLFKKCFSAGKPWVRWLLHFLTPAVFCYHFFEMLTNLNV